MSFVTAPPAKLASAARELQTFGCAVAAGSMAAVLERDGTPRQ